MNKIIFEITTNDFIIWCLNLILFEIRFVASSKFLDILRQIFFVLFNSKIDIIYKLRIIRRKINDGCQSREINILNLIKVNNLFTRRKIVQITLVNFDRLNYSVNTNKTVNKHCYYTAKFRSLFRSITILYH